MRNFQYATSTDVRHAIARVAADPDAHYVGGGTTLVDLMKLEVETPSQLVDINRLPLGEIDTGLSWARVRLATEGAAAAPVIEACLAEVTALVNRTEARVREPFIHVERESRSGKLDVTDLVTGQRTQSGGTSSGY